MTQPSDLYPQPLIVGLLAQRPTFVSMAGQLFYATDTTTLYICTVAGTSATWATASGGGGGSPGGSNTDVQFNDSSSFNGAANVTYTKATGVLTANQLANSNETIFGQRFTDTTPTGNFLHFENTAGSADEFIVDVSGNVTMGNTLTGGPSASFVITSENAITAKPATTFGIGNSNGFTVNGGFNNKITTYNQISTVSNGVPSELATVDLTSQTAAIASTTLYTPAATGLFRISVYAKVTTAATTAALGGVAGFTLGYTDGTDSVAQTAVMQMATEAGTAAIINANSTTSGKLIGTSIIYAKTNVAITYAFDYASSVGTMAYELHVKVEAL